MSKKLYKSKMTLEVVDIVKNSAAAGQEEESDTMEPPVKEEKEEAAPKRCGRPPGSKDKQPRQRVPRVPAAMETEDIEEAPILKRSKKRATTLSSAPARRRVQVAVESDFPESASTE